MSFSEEDKRVIAWMNRMLGLRVFYVDEDEAPPTCPTCPTCGQRVAHEGRQRRVREGVVTKVYDCLVIAELQLDDGTLLGGVRPSHVDIKHGIEGVHRGYFFPVAGEWPEAAVEASCR
jgi:hypothetical protein